MNNLDVAWQKLSAPLLPHVYQAARLDSDGQPLWCGWVPNALFETAWAAALIADLASPDGLTLRWPGDPDESFVLADWPMPDVRPILAKAPPAIRELVPALGRVKPLNPDAAVREFARRSRSAAPRRVEYPIAPLPGLIGPRVIFQDARRMWMLDQEFSDREYRLLTACPALDWWRAYHLITETQPAGDMPAWAAKRMADAQAQWAAGTPDAVFAVKSLVGQAVSFPLYHGRPVGGTVGRLVGGGKLVEVDWIDDRGAFVSTVVSAHDLWPAGPTVTMHPAKGARPPV